MTSTAEALAAAWNVHQGGDFPNAEATYRRVLADEPKNSIAWCYLGMVCHDQNRFAEAETAYHKALDLNQNFPVAWNNLGNTLQAVLRLDESLRAYERALALKPDYANAHTNRGLALLMQGRYAEGFAEYEWRMHNKSAVRAWHATPRWDGSPLAGRTLLMEAEQGIGDAIQFVRYAAEIKRLHDARVLVAVHPQLVPITSGVAGADAVLSQDRERPPFDVWAPMLSLPGLMKHDLATFPNKVPYLKADPDRVKYWHSCLAGIKGVKIGVAWQGQKSNLTDRKRSFALQQLVPLGRLEGVTLVSLQKGEGSEQIAELTDFDVVSLGDEFDSSGGAFMDTAAVMQNLDLVISADTSVAHVAGAIGVKVWLALAYAPDWRWTLQGERTPWYSSMRIFRQTSLGDWPGVFERMAAALRSEHQHLVPKQGAPPRPVSTPPPKTPAVSTNALNDRGIALAKEFKFGEAADCFRQALAANPLDFATYNNLGIALASEHHNQQAVAAFRRAIDLAPEFAEAHNNLGMTFNQLGDYQQALACFDQAVRLKSDYPDPHSNSGIALTGLGRIDEAMNRYGIALSMRPDYPEAHMNLGVLTLLKGDYEAGWLEYDWRLKNPANYRVLWKKPRWDGSPLAGRTLLLEAEQGMGDTIQFVRYAAEIKRQHEGQVIVAVEPQLVPLLENIEGPDQLIGQKQERPSFDVWAPLMSTPGLMKHNLATFPWRGPYIKPEQERVEKWKARLADVRGLKIGIAWQGRKLNSTDVRRSFSLASFAPLGKLHGLTLISLQKGEGSDQLDSLTEFDVLSLGDDFDSSGGAFLDTAAVMQSLDLVISADTSVAHVAGASGVPVWVALSQVPDWRWTLEGERTPWYPSMRLFRQTALGDWASVFERMAQTLRAQHPELTPKQPADFRVASSGFNHLARTRHGLMLFNRHDAYIGKSLGELGEFSEAETDVFRQLIRPGSTIVEAGANVGAHTVPLARLVGEGGVVHAFEPQRMVFQTLCANVALNSLTNVHCHQAAAGENAGFTVVPTLNFNQPNNFGGLSLGEYKEGDRVPVVTIDSLNLPRCDFLKVDVEGMELAVLKGAKETIQKFRPILYVENDRQEKSAALIEALQGLGYQLFWHLPQYFNRVNYYGSSQNSFGGLVSVNMLGLHVSVTANISGLARVEGPKSDWRTRGESSAG